MKNQAISVHQGMGKLRQEKTLEHFNRLTPAEDERLALLIEEIGEVLQILGKIQRHGYDSRHPSGGPTNRELLEKELGDVSHAKKLLCNAGDLSSSRIQAWSELKREKVKPFLHHQQD